MTIEDTSDITEAPILANVSVTKSNDLVNAVYRLTLVESQLLHFCIAWARERQNGLDANKPLRLHVSDFAVRFGLDPKSAYQQAKEALEGLYKREVSIYEIDAETGRDEFIRTRWLSRYSYIDGAGVMSVIFSIDVIKHITRLERAFTSYRLTEIAPFTSYYAVRLYEILMQFKDKGWRTVSIEDLRTAFGIGKTEYPRFSNLKARAIDVAVAQINQLSQWDVRYQNHKHGVRIIGLTFHIKRKRTEEPPKPEKPKMDKPYVERHARAGESWDDAYARLWAAWQKGINYDEQRELFEKKP